MRRPATAHATIAAVRDTLPTRGAFDPRQFTNPLGAGHHVATVCCDRMERYVSTDLFDDLGDSG